MIDQADRLREIIDKLKRTQDENQIYLRRTPPNRNSRVISVTSGKGGVGKTNITINLAMALSELGARVVIIDADFGLANIDILLGITPKYTLLDMIKNGRNIIELLASGPNNIKFLSGGSGVEELVRLDSSQLRRVLDNLLMLDRIADIILIDTGAGLSDNVMSILMAADEVILVTTPEPTAVTDAYALIKLVSGRDRNKNIKLIVNKAENAKEADDILDKITLVADRFLEIKLNQLGYILRDGCVEKAVKTQQPFFLVYPKSAASKYISSISKKILVENEHIDESISDTGIKGFVNKLINIMKVD